jgi:hypothetical protein
LISYLCYEPCFGGKERYDVLVIEVASANTSGKAESLARLSRLPLARKGDRIRGE